MVEWIKAPIFEFAIVSSNPPKFPLITTSSGIETHEKSRASNLLPSPPSSRLQLFFFIIKYTEAETYENGQIMLRTTKDEDIRCPELTLPYTQAAYNFCVNVYVFRYTETDRKNANNLRK